ncbi:MAG: Bcep22 gp55 [Alphaproteobacteria bacterium]|jgi:N4-gp56 family major capsid protein|nr:Bcep22 gp55 [Alphaproteobacteria bacterium]
MSGTVFGTSDVKTQKKWSTNLAIDHARKSYFEGRFIGDSDNHIIQKKNDLESDAGDRVSFDLCVQLRGKPTYGDAKLKGKTEGIKFFTDEVVIDQVRHGIDLGGKMSRKRIVHDVRKIGKGRLSDYFAKLVDEFFFIYLSGARGINEDFIEDTSFAGFAGNALQAPDADHILYAGPATSKATLTAADKMTRLVVERAQNKGKMMQARNPETANMVPVSNGAEDQYVLLMSEDQAFDLRTADTAGWVDFQKAAAASEGRNNPIFKGQLGLLGNTVLHAHRSVIRFSDYGASSNVNAARALFLGRQAGVVAYGNSGGGMRYTWEEEVDDFGNNPQIASGFIAGIKKARFNNKDFGVISIDTAAKDPNAA